MNGIHPLHDPHACNKGALPVDRTRPTPPTASRGRRPRTLGVRSRGRRPAPGSWGRGPTSVHFQWQGRSPLHGRCRGHQPRTFGMQRRPVAWRIYPESGTRIYEHTWELWPPGPVRQVNEWENRRVPDRSHCARTALRVIVPGTHMDSIEPDMRGPLCAGDARQHGCGKETKRGSKSIYVKGTSHNISLFPHLFSSPFLVLQPIPPTPLAPTTHHQTIDIGGGCTDISRPSAGGARPVLYDKARTPFLLYQLHWGSARARISGERRAARPDTFCNEDDGQRCVRKVPRPRRSASAQDSRMLERRRDWSARLTTRERDAGWHNRCIAAWLEGVSIFINEPNRLRRRIPIWTDA